MTRYTFLKRSTDTIFNCQRNKIDLQLFSVYYNVCTCPPLWLRHWVGATNAKAQKGPNGVKKWGGGHHFMGPS